jgi:hypothetical protein
MLTTASTIGKSFQSNIATLAPVRSNYTVAYATDLNLRIATTMETWLGADALKVLRDATTSLATLQVPAMRDLSFFKTQIAEDFKKEPAMLAEMLNNLGFTKHLAKVQLGNQEALSELLFAFKKNMTDDLKLQLVAKGMGAGLIDNIMGYASNFAEANVAQENSKNSAKEITQEGVDAFNAIYDEVISICKIAAKYFKDEPLKKEQFTFSKVAAKIGGTNKGNPPATEAK